MADLQEVFRILKDSATGAGEAPISRIEGEAAAAQEGLIGFSFKDSSGNVILPQLDSNGAILVNDEVEGTLYHEYAEVAAGSLALTDVATITLTVSKVYDKINAEGCCLRPSLFQLVHIDDSDGTPVETVMGEFIVGPGQYSFKYDLAHEELDTTGGTGVIELVLRAKNFAYASSLRGFISANEQA